jgi:hypothetical protein
MLIRDIYYLIKASRTAVSGRIRGKEEARFVKLE